jgi:hypothetical protein
MELSKSLIEQWLNLEDKEFYIDKFREKHSISPENSNFYKSIERLVNEKKLRRIGRGLYKKIDIVTPVPIFSKERERKPPFDLYFPVDYDTKQEMGFAEHIVIRGGDLILIPGMSNFGKTAIALNFGAENIDYLPVLMGNEYTTMDNQPTPRFLNRLDSMDWVQWTNDGTDKLTLLPVREDYAEHIIKDRINIIDWVNLDEHYMISKVMEDIKKNLGEGVGIIVIQKAEGMTSGRGGQFTKDFADCELLIDKFSDMESLLTIGKVKEYTKPIIGNTYAFGISKGVKIINFREVKKCPACRATGYIRGEKCSDCFGHKYVDK